MGQSASEVAKAAAASESAAADEAVEVCVAPSVSGDDTDLDVAEDEVPTEEMTLDVVGFLAPLAHGSPETRMGVSAGYGPARLTADAPGYFLVCLR
jgi:hypothetical protein